MKYTDETLFVFAISEFIVNSKNIISGHKDFSNADFYKFSYRNDFNKFQAECEDRIRKNGYIDQFYNFKDHIKRILDRENGDSHNVQISSEEKCKALIDLSESTDGILSPFDADFPQIYPTVKKNGDKPFLLFYKGDISLFKELQKNVAVIGLLNPDENIEKREVSVVKKLIEYGMNIVSGLAKGCDTIAHKACLESNGKTIAVLPSPLSQIFPAENRGLAYDIVDSGGLLISEYYKKPASKFESTKRFIDRDRLQAMFSKAILLSASYSEGMGDSGSRHAMGKAEEYGLFMAMLYNESSDKDNPQFGLNRKYNAMQKVNILTQSVLEKMIHHSINDDKSIKKYQYMQEQLPFGM